MRSRGARVVAVDHIVIRVSDFSRSKTFYDALFGFLGFKVLDEYEDAIGWTNGKTRFWLGPADAQGRKRKYRLGDVGPLCVRAAQPQGRGCARRLSL